MEAFVIRRIRQLVLLPLLAHATRHSAGLLAEASVRVLFIMVIIPRKPRGPKYITHTHTHAHTQMQWPPSRNKKTSEKVGVVDYALRQLAVRLPVSHVSGVCVFVDRQRV